MAEASDAVDSNKKIHRLPTVSIDGPVKRVDVITIAGLIIALGLIVSALIVGGSPQAFVNPAALMIVIGGTFAVTATSYMSDDLKKTGRIITETIFYEVRSPQKVARELLDLAVIARQKSLLSLTDYMGEIRKDSLIYDAFVHLVDGFEGKNMIKILENDIESSIDQSNKSSGILRRAAEVAPAMGLIGTLVGLVQMLSVLQNPESIGPAMSIALLTTFYGAMLGTVILSPLAAKIEQRLKRDTLIRQLVLTTVTSIASQENPRQLEVGLNAVLPADQRIIYFT